MDGAKALRIFLEPLLFQAALREEDISKAFARADYHPLLTWMRDRVHAKGSVLLPQELMTAATGAPTSAEHHLRHLRERFLPS